LYVAPTRSGKTVFFIDLIAGAYRKGLTAGIVLHRDELIGQTAQALTDAGIPFGVNCSNNELVQIISVDTRKPLRRFTWLIFDEAHHVLPKNKWGRLLDLGAYILGVTATPERLDGRGLGDTFQVMVIGPTEQELIDNDPPYLQEPTVYAPPSGADWSSVATRGGDYAPEEAAAIMDQPTITGDAIAHYKRLCYGKPAIVFCTTIAHSKHFAAACVAAGIPAEHVDGTTPKRDRRAAIERFKSGDTWVLTNVALFTEGVNLPLVYAVFMLRRTKSLALWRQAGSRCMTIAEGKDAAILCDHAGNVFLHGLPTEKINWTLEGKAKRKREQEAAIAVQQCPKCYAAFSPAKVCPACGHVFAADNSDRVLYVDGELTVITKEELKAQRLEWKRKVGRARTLQDLYDLAAELKTPSGEPYKPAWADAIYISRHGESKWAQEKARMSKTVKVIAQGQEFKRVV
jgi:DNA repair protein RadD